MDHDTLFFPLNNFTLFIWILTLSLSFCETPLRNGRESVGVLMLAEATIRISRNRGIPRVTFISPLPAKWKVFRVI